ncbi:MAG TPA: peptidoglycan-binding domain-containing protein [Xanthobacteraceae bacterium]|nr:peptidoglycan-binding domain-containing protein [Xanthobacteraceae bacterium]
MSRRRTAAVTADDDDWMDDTPARGGGRLRGALAALGWPTRDMVVLGVAVVGALAIMVNALFLQTGRHPAPLFSTVVPAQEVPAEKVVTVERITPPQAGTTAGTTTGTSAPHPAASLPAASAEQTGAIAALLPRPRPAEPAAAPAETAKPAATRYRPDLIANIQRELGQRGFFEDLVDGQYGPKTEAAIRDFERVAGLKPAAEPNEMLLAAIARSNLMRPSRGIPSAKAANGAATPRPAARTDGRGARAEAPAGGASPSTRVVAVQRALTDWGYGQIKPSGQVDGDTTAAIEKFERERNMPVTGQVTDALMRELAMIIGRPLE